MPENITEEPQYEQAIAGIKGQLTGGLPRRVDPDEQEEYADSIKEMLLQQGIEEGSPKKKERGGVHTVLKFFPGYAQGLQQRQAYDQKNEYLKLEQQSQKGIIADRQLRLRKQLDEIRLKREERQQRRTIGSALSQLNQGGLDKQATGELQGQVRQGLIGIGEEKLALEYGKPERLGPKEVNTPFEAILADEAQKGGGDVYERAIKRYGKYQQAQREGTGSNQVNTPFEAVLADERAKGGNYDTALERYRNYQQDNRQQPDEETRKLRRESLELDIARKKRDAGGELTPIDKEKFALDIRRNIRQEPSFKTFQGVRDGYQAVITGGKRNDSVGDLAMINGLQRIVDPLVSVREGEFKTVAEAQGYLQRLFNSKERFFEGDLLSPKYRGKVIEYAGDIARVKVATAREELDQVYGDSAKAAGVDLQRLLPLELESKRGGKAQEKSQGQEKSQEPQDKSKEPPVTAEEIAELMQETGKSAEEVIKLLKIQKRRIEGLD